MVRQTESKSFLQWIDMFGIEHHKTRIGGCFSIMLIILMIVFAINLFSQILNRTNPQILYQQKQINQPLRHDLTLDNFAIAVTLLDEALKPFYDETIYQVSAQVFHKNQVYDEIKQEYVEDIGDVDIEMERCTQNHFQEKESRDYFLSLDYTKMYCLKPGQTGLFLEGQYDAEKFNMVRINIQECLNNSNCKDPKIRKNALKDTKLQFYYVNSVVQITELDKPFKRIGQTQFWRTNYDMVQQINMQFINTFVEDDMDLFYSESLTVHQDMIFSSERTLQGAREPNSDKNIYQIEMFMEKNKENVYKRTYLRIPQAVSQIGGIFNVFFALGCIFSKPYAKLQLQRKIINQTFSFSDGDQSPTLQNNKQDNSPQKIIKMNNKQESIIESSPKKNPSLKKLDFAYDFYGNTKAEITSFKSTRTKIKSQEDMLNKEVCNLQIVPPVTEATPKEDNDTQHDQNKIQNNNNQNNSSNLKEEKSKIALQQKLSQRQSIVDQKEIYKNFSAQNKDQQQILFSDNDQQPNNSEEDKEDKQDENIIKELFNFVKIGTSDYLKSYLTYFQCCRSNQSTYLNYCTNKLNEFTDVCSIINKQIELQHIKHLIFTDDQQSLFKLIPKPRIDNKVIQRDPSLSILVNNINDEIGSKQNSISLLQKQGVINKLQKMRKAQTAYKNIKEQNIKQNNLDEKLIQMMGQNQIKIFEKNNLQMAQDKFINFLPFKKISVIKSPASRKANENQIISSKQYQSPNLIQISTVQNNLNVLKLSQESISQINEDLNASPQKIYLQKDISLIPIPKFQQKNSQQEKCLIQEIEPIESLQISQILDKSQNIL